MKNFEILFAFLVIILVHEIHGTCPPLRSKKGVSVKCMLPDLKTTLDCAGELPSGTEAFYQCQKHYVNADGTHFGGKVICNSQGRWLKIGEYSDFFCAPECGRSRNASLTTLSSFIEREHETGDEIFPWHAAIFRRFGDTSLFKYSCGGTLVNPGNKGFIVLTAAHCITKNPLTAEPGALDAFRVVLGAVSTEFRGNTVGESQIFSVKKIVTEKEYDPHSLQSDIAMIELSGFVKITDTVQPVCFPTRTIANAQVRPGMMGEIPIIRNDQLAYQEILKLPVAEQGECLRDCSREPTITEFCTMTSKGVSLTSVDSGTGVVFYDESPKSFFLQGILTKVAGDAEGCATHNTFTSVSVFLDWVNRVHDELAESQQRFKEVTVPPPKKSTSRPSKIPTINSIEEKPERPQSNTPSTALPSIFESEFSKIGLDLHNFYREKHHSPALQLNGKLSREAQDWAEYLLRENKWEFSDGKDYSENIFQYFGKISANEVIRKAVNNWYEASAKYNWNNPEASTFSQLVWKATSHIGIGVATKGTKSVVVTNYWPKGNIYNIGEGDRGKYFKENVLNEASREDEISLI